MFLTFWLGNVLRATAAYSGMPFFDLYPFKSGPNPSSRHSCVPFFCIFTSKSGPVLVCFVHFEGASRHSGGDFSFLIWPHGSAALASLLFDPLDPQIIGQNMKNTVFCDFPNISRTCIFFLLTLSLSLFHSSLLCFSSLHIVGSLTSKLPLIYICMCK